MVLAASRTCRSRSGSRPPRRPRRTPPSPGRTAARGHVGVGEVVAAVVIELDLISPRGSVPDDARSTSFLSVTVMTISFDPASGLEAMRIWARLDTRVGRNGCRGGPRSSVPDAVAERRSRVPDQHGPAAVGFIGDRGPQNSLTRVAEIVLVVPPTLIAIGVHADPFQILLTCRSSVTPMTIASLRLAEAALAMVMYLLPSVAVALRRNPSGSTGDTPGSAGVVAPGGHARGVVADHRHDRDRRGGGVIGRDGIDAIHPLTRIAQVELLVNRLDRAAEEAFARWRCVLLLMPSLTVTAMTRSVEFGNASRIHVLQGGDDGLVVGQRGGSRSKGSRRCRPR